MEPGKNTYECSVDIKGLPSGIYTVKIFVWYGGGSLRPILSPEKFQFEVFY